MRGNNYASRATALAPRGFPGARVCLSLPWPPSVNAYWVWTPKGLALSDRAKEYHLAVMALARQQCKRFRSGHPLPGPVGIRVKLHPPEKRRRRDGDNLFKAIFDSLVHAKVLEDDSLRVVPFCSWEGCRADGLGRVELEITRWAQ